MKKLRGIFSNKSRCPSTNQSSPTTNTKSSTSGTPSTTTTTTTTSTPELDQPSDILENNENNNSIHNTGIRIMKLNAQARIKSTSNKPKSKNSSSSQRSHSRGRSCSKGRQNNRARSSSSARKRRKSRSSSREENEKPRLEKKLYFHGVLPRHEVTTLLCDEGDFLLREAGTSLLDTHIMLSVMHKGQTRHLDLQPGDNGLFEVDGHEPFQTVPELVNWYMINQTPVSSKCPAVLRRAIERQEWELQNDDVDVGSKIGGGNFGEVFQGYLRIDNSPIAIKMYRLVASTNSRASSKAIKRAKTEFVNEAKLMRTFRHQNIVRLIGICASKDPMMIVMEYCPNGALNIHLEDFKPNVKRKMAYVTDIVKGMSFLEKHNCIHRDLAARNCLLSEKWIVKISDFGLSRQSTSPYVTKQQYFPIKWSAPEAVVHHVFTLKSDVWSFGILLWEVFTDGAIIHPTMSNKEVADCQLNPPGLIPDVPEEMPAKVVELFQKCLLYKKEDRPTFSELETSVSEIREYIKQGKINENSGSKLITIPTDFKTIPTVPTNPGLTHSVSPRAQSPVFREKKRVSKTKMQTTNL